MAANPSPKQLLARQRNFGKLRLAGAFTHLQNLSTSEQIPLSDQMIMSRAASLLKPVLARWDADTKSLLEDMKKEKFFITFPNRIPQLRDKYLLIEAWTNQEAREKAHSLTQGTFAFLYPIKDLEHQIRAFGITEATEKEVINQLELSRIME